MKKLYLLWVVCGCILLSKCTPSAENESKEALNAFLKISKKASDTGYYKNRTAYLSLLFQNTLNVQKLKDTPTLTLNYYKNAGYMYQQNHMFNESLNMYKEFFIFYDSIETRLNQKIKEDFFNVRSFGYRQLSTLHQNLSNLDSAETYHKKNIELTKNINSIMNPAAINEYAYFLLTQKKDTTNALKLFIESYILTKKNFSTHDLLAGIRDNISDIYFGQKKFKKAYDFNSLNISFNKNIIQNKNTSAFNRGVAVKRYLKAVKKNIQILSLKPHFGSLENLHYKTELFYQNDLKNYHKIPEHSLIYLEMKKEYYLARDNYTSSFKILEKLKSLSDSITIITEKNSKKHEFMLANLHKQEAQKRFKIEREQEKVKSFNQKLIAVITILILLGALSIFSFLYYIRQKQLMLVKNQQIIDQQNLELTKIKNVQLRQEIESKKRDLVDFSLTLTQNKEWTKVLLDKINTLKSSTGRARKKELIELETEIANKTSFDNETQEFYHKLDTLSHSFYQKLDVNYPNLSKTDKKLCSLIRLNIDSVQIATLQNISVSSLNTHRYRLRKKMNLKKEVDLNTHLQSL